MMEKKLPPTAIIMTIQTQLQIILRLVFRLIHQAIFGYVQLVLALTVLTRQQINSPISGTTRKILQASVMTLFLPLLQTGPAIPGWDHTMALICMIIKPAGSSITILMIK